jgi:hypothetical protein
MHAGTSNTADPKLGAFGIFQSRPLLTSLKTNRMQEPQRRAKSFILAKQPK